MTAFEKFMASIPKKYVPEVEKAINHALQVIGDPNATDEDYKNAARDLDEIPKKVGKDSSQAWKDQVRDELQKRLGARGMDPNEAAKMVDSRLERLMGKMDSAQTVVQAAKTSWAAFAKVAATAMGAATLLTLSIYGGWSRGGAAHDTAQDMSRSAELFKQEQEFQRLQKQFDEMSNLTVTGDEYQSMITNLIPAPGVVPSPVEAALPARVAELPVTATISTPAVATQINTTVGQVVAALPPSIREQVGSAIVHHSDIPSSYTSGHTWNRTITVSSPVGTFSGCCF